MKIGIIGAMDEEIALVNNSMTNPKKEVIASYEFISGTIYGKDVVLLKSGIGKVNAAIGTTLLQHIYKPSHIINTGSAGGSHPKLSIGDVVISSEVMYHDVDVTAFGYEFGQIPQMPTRFVPDTDLVNIAEKCGRQVMDQQIVKGVIASGDSFIQDDEQMEGIQSRWNDIYAVEMEAAAIAHVCHRFNVPFVIIRSLSDIAGKSASISFEQYLQTASENAAKHILAMVEELSDNE